VYESVLLGQFRAERKSNLHAATAN
jgi:hypothetical protein